MSRQNYNFAHLHALLISVECDCKVPFITDCMFCFKDYSVEKRRGNKKKWEKIIKRWECVDWWILKMASFLLGVLHALRDKFLSPSSIANDFWSNMVFPVLSCNKFINVYWVTSGYWLFNRSLISWIVLQEYEIERWIPI